VAVPTDEIYEKYLQKAISEINDLGDEIARAAGERATVLGSGHPLADVLLLKYSPQESEFLCSHLCVDPVEWSEKSATPKRRKAMNAPSDAMLDRGKVQNSRNAMSAPP